MTSYYGIPLTSLSDAAGVDTWVWADHAGLHCQSTTPQGHVPTGHVWGWGQGTWVHWRDDAVAPPCGILVKSERFGGATELQALDWQGGAVPHVVTDRNRFMKAATADDEQNLAGLGSLRVLSIVSPTQALLVGVSPG